MHPDLEDILQSLAVPENERHHGQEDDEGTTDWKTIGIKGA